MANKNNCFSVGDEIYRRSNPGRRGIITDRPPLERGGSLRFQVKFHDGGAERIPECEWRFNNSDPKFQLNQLKQLVRDNMG